MEPWVYCVAFSANEIVCWWSFLCPSVCEMYSIACHWLYNLLRSSQIKWSGFLLWEQRCTKRTEMYLLLLMPWSKTWGGRQVLLCHIWSSAPPQPQDFSLRGHMLSGPRRLSGASPCHLVIEGSYLSRWLRDPSCSCHIPAPSSYSWVA